MKVLYLILSLAVLLGISFFIPVPDQKTASISDLTETSPTSTPSPENEEPEEIQFETPERVSWTGNNIAVLSGGSCMGIENSAPFADSYTKFFACLQDLESDDLWDYLGKTDISIGGQWVGITCAYRNTIFGSCVPDILIETINGKKI